jgi:hypothetical protein
MYDLATQITQNLHNELARVNEGPKLGPTEIYEVLTTTEQT